VVDGTSHFARDAAHWERRHLAGVFLLSFKLQFVPSPLPPVLSGRILFRGDALPESRAILRRSWTAVARRQPRHRFRADLASPSSPSLGADASSRTLLLILSVSTCRNPGKRKSQEQRVPLAKAHSTTDGVDVPLRSGQSHPLVVRHLVV
jgi:hypothetical protein